MILLPVGKMDETILKDRILKFAIGVYQFTQSFPKQPVYWVVERQILKSSSSSGANYRAACRGKSSPDFINKLKIVEEELDETLYWLEYLNNIDQKWISDTKDLYKEGDELLRIIVSSIKTSRRNYANQ